MTQAEVRAALVTALSKIAELSPGPYPPDTITAYAAWPVWEQTEPLNPCVYPSAWHVWVALPAGSRAATVAAGDQLAEAIADVLWTTPIQVVRYVPDGWEAEPGGATIPALHYTLQT